MNTIGAEQLKKMREEGEDFALINVLAPEQFNIRRIPGSVNIPVSDRDFEQKVREEVGGKDRTIVVYCANRQCTASPTAAEKLDRAGFTRVYDYEAGMQGWAEAGYPVEGEQPS